MRYWGLSTKIILIVPPCTILCSVIWYHLVDRSQVIYPYLLTYTVLSCDTILCTTLFYFGRVGQFMIQEEEHKPIFKVGLFFANQRCIIHMGSNPQMWEKIYFLRNISEMWTNFGQVKLRTLKSNTNLVIIPQQNF